MTIKRKLVFKSAVGSLLFLLGLFWTVFSLSIIFSQPEDLSLISIITLIFFGVVPLSKGSSFLYKAYYLHQNKAYFEMEDKILVIAAQNDNLLTATTLTEKLGISEDEATHYLNQTAENGLTEIEINLQGDVYYQIIEIDDFNFVDEDDVHYAA